MWVSFQWTTERSIRWLALSSFNLFSVVFIIHLEFLIVGLLVEDLQILHEEPDASVKHRANRNETSCDDVHPLSENVRRFDGMSKIFCENLQTSRIRHRRANNFLSRRKSFPKQDKSCRTAFRRISGSGWKRTGTWTSARVPSTPFCRAPRHTAPKPGSYSLDRSRHRTLWSTWRPGTRRTLFDSWSGMLRPWHCRRLWSSGRSIG